MQSVERVRTDSTGSAVSTDDSEQGGGWGSLTWASGMGLVQLLVEEEVPRLGVGHVVTRSLH